MPQDDKLSKKPSRKKLTEDEKRELKIAKQQKLLKDQFDRELKFADLSHPRNVKTHLKLTEKFKTESILTELIASIQLSHHQINKIENAIDTIKIHREHASEQHLRAQTDHSKLIKYMKDLFNLFQNSLNEMYEARRRSLIDDFFAEKINFERILHGRKRYYENFAHASVSLLKSRLENEREKFIDNKINIEAGSIMKNEEMNKRKFQFEKKICNEIERIFKNFSQVWPRHRIEEYQAAFNDDNKVCGEIEKLKIKMRNTENEVEKLRKLWHKELTEKSAKASKFKSEYQNLLKMFKAMKLKNKETFDIDSHKMKVLTKASGKAKKYLQKNLATIERMSIAIKFCERYETIHDRVEFYDRKADFSESSEDFNRKLSQKKFDFGFRSSIAKEFVHGETSNVDNKASTCFHTKKLKCIAINNQSFLKRENFTEYSKNLIHEDPVTRNKNEAYDPENPAHGPLSFLRIFNQDYHIKSDVEKNENLSCKSSKSDIVMSTKHPLCASLNPLKDFNENEIIANEFFSKLSIVEADCITLKNYKQKLATDNENLRKFLSKKKHELEVNRNIRLLRLNSSLSVGRIGQISHQMPQIQEEIFIRNCRSLHVKLNKSNKTTL